MPSSAPPSWLREVAFRMRRHFVLKLAGTTVWVWIFFIGYFHMLRHAVYPVTIVPLTALDSWVPTLPIALVPYLSLWFYVGIAPGLQRTFRELLIYGLWAGLLCAGGLAIFYRWPTRIPPFVFDGGGFPGFDLLAGIDSPGNACPSMHVAFAVFTGLRIEALCRTCRIPGGWRILNVAWCLAITYSTVAIRQHVVLDAVAGAAFGAVFAGASLVLHRRPDSRPGPRDGKAMIAAEAPTEAATGRAPKTKEMMGIAR